MYTAALVIGVGGTGRWVLTHLRSRLLADGRLAGADPAALDAVKLLGFDIDSQNVYEFAGHSLAESEVQYSTPELADVIHNIRDNRDNDHNARYQEIREWISQEDAEAYDLALLNDFMDSGAGQMRQWGRLGVVLAQGLYERIRTIVGTLAKGGRVDVFVTGSLCGGTGSATLFDVAAIVHDVLQYVAPDTRNVSGVFLLPAGLTSTVSSAEFPWLEACAYASLRELDRFQRGSLHNTLKHNGREIVLRNRLFSTCYLLDGVREQVGGTVQDVINTQADHGVDAAMGDLIYSYLNPASGSRLNSDAGNDVSHMGGNHPFKYSKFGVHTLWSPLPLVQRSLVIDDALAVLDALTAPTAQAINTGLVATPETSFEGKDGKRTVFNAQVFQAIGQRAVRAPRWSEVLPWLLPADPKQKPKTPAKPDFAHEFPNIRRFRTPYENATVKPRVDDLLRRHLDEIRDLSADHRAPLIRDFRTYLLVQCQRITNEPSRKGGLARARGALVEMETAARTLRERFTSLNEEEAKAGRLATLRLNYADARTALDNNSIRRDAANQRELFEAAYRLIDAELDAQTRSVLIELMEELERTITNVCDDEISTWQQTLEELSAEARQASSELDRIWAEHKAVVVRTVLLNRHSGLEREVRQQLTEQIVARVPRGRRSMITSPAAAFVEEQTSWSVAPDPLSGTETITLRGPWRREGRIELTDLITALEAQYALVLQTPFGKAVEHAAQSVESLAAELRDKSGMLASGAQEATRPPHPLPIEDIEVFGPWGDGTPATNLLRRELVSRGIPATAFEDVLSLRAADPDAARDVPLNQNLWALRTYHGVSIDGFGKTDGLRRRYLELRGGEKPLHIFPEEQAAVVLEKEIHELIRSGEMSWDGGLLGPEAASLAKGRRLLRQVVLVLAGDSLKWVYDRVDDVGEWSLDRAGAASLVVARGPKAAILIPTLLQHTNDSSPMSQRVVEAMDLAARAAQHHEDADTTAAIEHIAAGKVAKFGLDGLSDDVALMLRISATALLR
ncbi:tubulin-like doman-containing protein [Nocardia sp. XZ_19_369]|uniref:tubulin-like doman-containing protein n=1 Tax=Nocardia sp. XZ_19_369 TaxID=2769487 RepID=UPI001E63A5C3|nr:tubulin-like doman-containing protein [Nocardia sp. XZ_19_369]